MNSPTHKENIIKKEYTEVGYAVVNGVLNGEETTLVVQMFGTPLVKNTESAQAPQIAPPIIKEVPVAQTVQKPAILGKAQKQNVPVNGKSVAYDINMLFIGFIVGALILDFIFAAKLDILHLRGNHIAHLLFLGFIGLGILFILKQGAIL